jgi:hypothetical protein
LAVPHKESVNGLFKSGNFADAARSYRQGARVKKLNANNACNEQVRSILVPLQMNLSIVTYKQRKYRTSRVVALKGAWDQPQVHQGAVPLCDGPPDAWQC